MKLSVKNAVATAALSAVVLASSSFVVSAEEYQIDPTHSFVEFKTKHLGFSWLSGRFNTIDGTMTFDPSKGAEAQGIELVIDANSIDTNHAERDKHLRSADFFDVANYPTITFKSTKFEGDENGGTLHGDLTLHGVTKPIWFEVKKIGEGKDPWGGYRAGFEGQYTLTRSDFDMNYDLGPGAQQVEVDLFIEAIKK